MAPIKTFASPPRELPVPMSYEEWLEWDDESTQSEWVNGEGIRFMPPSILHARALGFLYSLLSWYVEAYGLGEVLLSPVEMRLARSAREPDLLFVAREHLDRLTPKRLIGPADLVVEVVSDHSVRRDRIEKLAEYQAAGVPEYWLLDPRSAPPGADFFHLIDGAYRSVPVDADGRYHSRVVPGFWFRPSWLWQDALPSRRACLLAIAPDTL